LNLKALGKNSAVVVTVEVEVATAANEQSAMRLVTQRYL
jgi:hypothetical protein